MMKLTKQAEIAVQILALCAKPPSNAPVTTRAAAAFAGATKDHAAHIVTKLVRHGYLESERGRAGGIRLALSPSHVNVGDVIRLMEPSFDGRSDGLALHEQSVVSFGALVHAAIDSFVSTFDDFTIADLVGNPATGRIACLDCDIRFWVHRGRRLRPFLAPAPLPPSTAGVRAVTTRPV